MTPFLLLTLLVMNFFVPLLMIRLAFTNAFFRLNAGDFRG